MKKKKKNMTKRHMITRFGYGYKVFMVLLSRIVINKGTFSLALV
jgi:hypothetical protein